METIAKEAGINIEEIDINEPDVEQEETDTTMDESVSSVSSIFPSEIDIASEASDSSIESIPEDLFEEDEDNFYALDIEGINESTSMRAQIWLCHLFEDIRKSFSATEEQVNLNLESKKNID